MGLRERLVNPETTSKEKDKILKLLRLNNFFGEITLIAYCLMPNHFHFFIKQKSAGSIDRFMNSLGTRYTKYFNTKYERVGSLCQGVYKAVLIGNEVQFIYLSKYIHQQTLATPGEAWEASAIGHKQPSSYPEYLGQKKTSWVHPEEVLNHFAQINPHSDYKTFIEETNPDDLLSIQAATIDL